MNWEEKHELTEKLTRAILMGLTTYHISGIGTIELPTPQRNGTYTQKESYARMKAQVLVDRLPDKSEK